jgi:translocation and assembly module TamA
MTLARATLCFVALAALQLTGGCGKQPPDQRWVRRVTLEGVHTLRRVQILRGLETQRTGWWPFATKHWYDPTVLDRDVRRIEALYAANGFFAAKVVKREVKVRPGGRSVDIALTVREGAPTKVVAVELVGLDVLPQPLRDELRGGLGLEPGKRFSHRRYRRAKRELGTLLEQAGYYYARVSGEIKVDRERRTAAIHLAVEPGPHVRFGETAISGNGSIPSDKLLNLVTWQQGETYDPAEITRTRARLFNQRLFASVSIKLPKEPTPDAKVKIMVTPTKLRDLRLGVGFGFEKQRHEIRLSGRWTWRNFLGGMRTLTVRLRPAYVFLPTMWDAERTGAAVESEVQLTQPDIFGSGILAHGLTGYDLGIHEGYQYHGPRLQAGLERAFLRDLLRGGISWNFQFLDFFNIDEQAFEEGSTTLGLGFRDPYRLAWLEEFVQLDLRDQMVDPRAGFFAEVRTEQGFPQVGGEFTYVKVVPDLRGYVPLGTKRLILALRAQLGYLRPLAGDESPVTRRLALGGPNSHRGFTFGRLSPQATERRIPLGGNASLLGSADLRLRMFRLFGYWLSLVGFFDAGDVVSVFDDLAFDRLHLATGGSLLYQTPIGSVRIGIGVRLNRLEDTGDNPDPGSRLAFHLTLGEAF